MIRSVLLSTLPLAALLLHGCTDDDPLPRASLELDAGADGATVHVPGALAPALPADCPALGAPLPKTLACTGLYGAAGTASKAVHPMAREFAPGTELWTDGADKRRWMALPEGAQIDTSDPNGWVFPNGTRIWKEFAFGGKRVETRFMYKSDGLWLFATYAWNDADSEAVAVDGAEVPLARGGAHGIPTVMQCNECHRGARDKVLGFQQVLLGLPGATGLNLTVLTTEARLTHPPARTSYVIPDDGTGMSAQALSWIHVNCGVSCHNETGNAQANMSKMFLRIDPRTLDAQTPADWNIVKLTVGVPSMTANFLGGVRIVPGAPDDSLIVQLAQTRGSNRAMPPIGTRIVDPNGLAVVREWIERLGGHPAPHDAGAVLDAGSLLDGATADASPFVSDAGASDAGADEGTDAAGPDAAREDAQGPATEPLDAELPAGA